MSAVKVAFVGLGAIGLPMARSIRRAEFDVIGVEPGLSQRELAASLGIPSVSDINEAGIVDVVVVMVANQQQLSAVLDSAISAGRASDRAWIICSTLGPRAVEDAAARLTSEANSTTVIDAPVSGGVPRAAAGDLVLFVSGMESNVADVLPILKALGTPKIVGNHAGQGQAIKVVNQHLCATHIVAAAEALSLAEGLGLDQKLVLDALSAGAAASFMLADRGPRMIQGPDAPVLSQVGIFVKDTGLVAEAAEQAGRHIPLLRAAQDQFQQAADAGLLRSDDSSVIQTYATEKGAIGDH